MDGSSAQTLLHVMVTVGGAVVSGAPERAKA
jgi:hypothetical protein